MSSEDELFNKYICVDKGYTDCESDENDSHQNADHSKENTKKITAGQIEMLTLNMEGRSDGFTKGKMKSSAGADKLLAEWDRLANDLNAIGPPKHPTSKWRRIWTKMKSRKNKRTSSSALRTLNDNKKGKYRHPTSPIANELNETIQFENVRDVTGERGESIDDQLVYCFAKPKNEQSSVPRSQDEIKEATDQPSTSCKQVYRTSSGKVDNRIITADPVESVLTSKIEQQLSQIVNAISSISEQQAISNEAINQKLNGLAKKQADMNIKLNVIAKTIGIDLDDVTADNL
ncbi:uncharacterized protein LOC119067143 [Bradysia coprophila]|uniref:uncharacterized protein LOC119067143 n=1 Tax=Bradysia coprophila TaxID=38358 RepID=UPI00187D9BF5|nr:uncharacterized protein LOC119067143 [Bradysia coprophila]